MQTTVNTTGCACCGPCGFTPHTGLVRRRAPLPHRQRVVCVRKEMEDLHHAVTQQERANAAKRAKQVCVARLLELNQNSYVRTLRCLEQMLQDMMLQDMNVRPPSPKKETAPIRHETAVLNGMNGNSNGAPGHTEQLHEGGMNGGTGGASKETAGSSSNSGGKSGAASWNKLLRAWWKRRKTRKWRWGVAVAGVSHVCLSLAFIALGCTGQLFAKGPILAGSLSTVLLVLALPLIWLLLLLSDLPRLRSLAFSLTHFFFNFHLLFFLGPLIVWQQEFLPALSSDTYAMHWGFVMFFVYQTLAIVALCNLLRLVQVFPGWFRHEACSPFIRHLLSLCAALSWAGLAVLFWFLPIQEALLTSLLKNSLPTAFSSQDLRQALLQVVLVFSSACMALEFAGTALQDLTCVGQGSRRVHVSLSAAKTNKPLTQEPASHVHTTQEPASHVDTTQEPATHVDTTEHDMSMLSKKQMQASPPSNNGFLTHPASSSAILLDAGFMSRVYAEADRASSLSSPHPSHEPHTELLPPGVQTSANSLPSPEHSLASTPTIDTRSLNRRPSVDSHSSSSSFDQRTRLQTPVLEGATNVTGTRRGSMDSNFSAHSTGTVAAREISRVASSSGLYTRAIALS
eukprot:g3245.t1